LQAYQDENLSKDEDSLGNESTYRFKGRGTDFQTQQFLADHMVPTMISPRGTETLHDAGKQSIKSGTSKPAGHQGATSSTLNNSFLPQINNQIMSPVFNDGSVQKAPRGNPAAI